MSVTFDDPFSRLRCRCPCRRSCLSSLIYAVMKGAQSLRVFLIDGTNIKSDREPYFFPSKTL